MPDSEKSLKREIAKAQAENNADLERGRRAGNKKAKRGRPQSAGPLTRAHSKSRRARHAKAPNSASPFAYQHQYSRRNGAHKCPVSPTKKVEYDFDARGDSDTSRVEFKYVFALPGTPAAALNPFTMARACEMRERRIDARMMGHDMITLPHQLNQNQRAELARKIAQALSIAMDDAPVYLVIHAPDDNNDKRNFHVHASYPIRKIVPLENGDFTLGEKINFEKQPTQRRALGLVASNHEDLKRLRARIAGLCADALEESGESDRNVIERWRYGHLRLNGLEGDTQVKRAAARGDDVFVSENERRERQKHEGPGTLRLDGPSPIVARNEQLTPNDPLLILQKKSVLLLQSGAKKECKTWEEFRRLALDEFSVSLEFNQTKSTGRVSGIRWRQGDLKCSGKEIGLSLNQLRGELIKNGMSFAAMNPEYAPPLKPASQENEMPREQQKQKLSPTIPELRKMIADAAAARAAGVSGGTPAPVSAAMPEKPDLAKIMQSLANAPSSTKPTPAAPALNKTKISQLPPLSEYERKMLQWAWRNRSHRGKELFNQVAEYEHLIQNLRDRLEEIESNEPPMFDSWLKKAKGRESTEHEKWESKRKSLRFEITRFSAPHTCPELKSLCAITPADYEEIRRRELFNDIRWRQWLKRYLEFYEQALQLDAIEEYDRQKERAQNNEHGARHRLEELKRQTEKKYPRLIEKHEFFLRCLGADPDALEFDPASILDDPLSPDEEDALEQIRSGNTKYSTREYPQLIALHEQELKRMREQQYLGEFYQKPILAREPGGGMKQRKRERRTHETGGGRRGSAANQTPH